jgi:hypothetical protein
VTYKRSDDVTVTNNEMATLSARPFNPGETLKYAGSLRRPSRMAANFAGVSGANDARNDIVVRGNSPATLLWRLDGVNIPNPNHFGALGTSGGPVSMINANLLAKSDFLTGAFPAEYANALGSVFDLRLRKGNDEKHEFLAQVGFNGLERRRRTVQQKVQRPRTCSTTATRCSACCRAWASKLPARRTTKDFTFKTDIPVGKTGQPVGVDDRGPQQHYLPGQGRAHRRRRVRRRKREHPGVVLHRHGRRLVRTPLLRPHLRQADLLGLPHPATFDGDTVLYDDREAKRSGGNSQRVGPVHQRKASSTPP